MDKWARWLQRMLDNGVEVVVAEQGVLVPSARAARPAVQRAGQVIADKGQGEADVVSSPNEPWHVPALKTCGQCKMKDDAVSSCCAMSPGICGTAG